ncbi:MAG: c-type cytochrome [Caldilineaceae bacterium]|nr:c-type cytochrome [Caldilineaceae bacterium]
MKRPWYRFLYIRSPLVKIGLGLIAVLIAIAVLLFQGVIEEQRMAAQTANWEGRGIEKGAEIFATNCSTCHGMDGKGLPAVAPALNSKYFFTQRLTDVGWAGSLHDYVKLTVAAGRPSKVNTQWAQIMPTWSQSYGGPLRDDQVENVTAFVLNWEEDALQQGTADNPDPWQMFSDAPTKAPAGGAAAAAPEVAAEPTGPRPPAELFVSMGCTGCHNLAVPQTDNNPGPIAPNMGDYPERAGQRVAGESAEVYTHNSIVNPNAFVVPGYNPGVMPANFTERMSEEEINSLVQWLLDPNRPLQ